MNLPRLFRLLLVLSACAAILPAAEPKSAEKTDAVKRHPLKGVITSVNAEKSALMVKPAWRE